MTSMKSYRSLRYLLTLCCTIFTVQPSGRAQQPGTVDTTFLPGTSFALIQKIAVQADGKIILGGLITNYNNGVNRHLLRLNANGSLDDSFSTGEGFTAPQFLVVQVNGLAVQSDGKILVGGDFAAIHGVARQNLARLNSNGTVDASFNLSTDNTVRVVTPLGNGRFLIAGSFTKVNGVARKAVAIIHENGTLDPFNPVWGSLIASTVWSGGVQSNGKIVLGSSFGRFTGGLTYHTLARFNLDGSQDETFSSGQVTSAIQAIRALDVQADDKIVVVGTFAGLSGKTRAGVARLNADGTVDDGFSGAAFGNNTFPYSVKVQQNGKVLVAGQLPSFAGKPLRGYVRINADGSYDETFAMPFNSGLTALDVALQTDGKILIAGAIGNGTDHKFLQRLHGDGTTSGGAPNITVDPVSQNVKAGARVEFSVTAENATGYQWMRYGTNIPNATASTFVIDAVAQTDGGVYTVAVSNANGKSISEAALLNPISPAWPDLTFSNVGADGLSINVLHRNAAGDIYAGGAFTKFFGLARSRLAMIGVDGSMESFVPPATGSTEVHGIATQSSGKVLVVGNLAFAGVTYGSIARLNLNGTVDTTFGGGTGPNDTIFSVAVTSTDRVYAGGFFTQFNGAARAGIVRLSATGVLDRWGAVWPADIRPGVVAVIAIQSDGKILVGGRLFRGTLPGQLLGVVRLNEDGSFDTGFTPLVISGADPSQVNALVVQTDGKILVGGAFATANGQSYNGVVRLLASGTIDSTFLNPGQTVIPAFIHALALQADGRVIAGGAFASYGGVATRNLVRLDMDGGVDPTFTTTSGPAGLGGDAVRAITLLPSGKILVAGEFSSYNGFTYPRIARLHGGDGDRPRIVYTRSGQTLRITPPAGFRVQQATSLNAGDWLTAEGSGEVQFNTATGSRFIRLIKQP